MPKDLHDAESGRQAAKLIKDTLAELRPDVVATALIEATAELGLRVPSNRRFEFWTAFDTLLLTQKIRKDVL